MPRVRSTDPGAADPAIRPAHVADHHGRQPAMGARARPRRARGPRRGRREDPLAGGAHRCAAASASCPCTPSAGRTGPVRTTRSSASSGSSSRRSAPRRRSSCGRACGSACWDVSTSCRDDLRALDRRGPRRDRGGPAPDPSRRLQLRRAARSSSTPSGRSSPTASAADAVDEAAIAARLYTAGLPDPDLVIRTGGEQRLSNFLIWQSRLRGVLVVRRPLAGLRRGRLRRRPRRVRAALRAASGR